MRSIGRDTTRLRAIVVALACAAALLVVAAPRADTDPVDHGAGWSPAQVLVADDVPLGILPDVAAIALVVLVVTLLLLPISPCGRPTPRSRRGRAPPKFSVLG